MKYSYVIDHLSTPIAVIDRNRIIVDFNKAFAKRAGVDASEIIGKSCHSGAYGFSQPCSVESEQGCPLEKTFETKLPQVQVHHFWISDHAVVDEITTTPIIEDDGSVNLIIEEFRDVTKMLGLKKGIITTCSYCQNVRETNGEWVRFEKYLKSHTGAYFSHGVCEKCSEKLLA